MDLFETLGNALRPLTTAEKNELERYNHAGIVGCDLESKIRMTICEGLVKQGLLKVVAQNSGYKYFEKVK